MNRSNAALTLVIRALKALLLLCSVVFICILSLALVANSYQLTLPDAKADLPAVLFGAASLSFFMFSVLIAGWAAFFSMKTVQVVVHEAVESQMNTKVKLLEAELRGRVLSVLGHINGETSVNPKTLTPKDPERLAEAVSLCQQGYSFLKEVKGAAEYMGLNNLVFYASILGDKTRGSDMLQKARILNEAAKEHNATNLRLTACRAILAFSADARERNEAIETLKAIAGARDYSGISAKERTEARLHLASPLPEPSEPTPMDLLKSHPSNEPPCSQT